MECSDIIPVTKKRAWAEVDLDSVEYNLGFVIRKCDLGNKVLYKIPSDVYLVLDIGLFALCEILDAYQQTMFKFFSLGCSVLLHSVGAVSAFVILQKMVNRFLKENRVIDFFGKHSMVIYLVHQQMIYFTIGWFNEIVSSVTLVAINFVFTVLVSTVFSMLMHKTKISRFLIGSK